jgi:hypothetical protein
MSKLTTLQKRHCNLCQQIIIRNRYDKIHNNKQYNLSFLTFRVMNL